MSKITDSSSIGSFEIGVSNIGELNISSLFSSDNAIVLSPLITHYTIYLDQTTNDLTTDAYGNIALCSQPYAIAQDVASAIKLCLGELWYNTQKGVPFFQKIAAKPMNARMLITYIEDAAMTVPDVVQAKCTFNSFSGRKAQGKVLFIDSNGLSYGVTL